MYSVLCVYMARYSCSGRVRTSRRKPVPSDIFHWIMPNEVENPFPWAEILLEPSKENRGGWIRWRGGGNWCGEILYDTKRNPNRSTLNRERRRLADRRNGSDCKRRDYSHSWRLSGRWLFLVSRRIRSSPPCATRSPANTKLASAHSIAHPDLFLFTR